MRLSIESDALERHRRDPSVDFHLIDHLCGVSTCMRAGRRLARRGAKLCVCSLALFHSMQTLQAAPNGNDILALKSRLQNQLLIPEMAAALIL